MQTVLEPQRKYKRKQSGHGDQREDLIQRRRRLENQITSRFDARLSLQLDAVMLDLELLQGVV